MDAIYGSFNEADRDMMGMLASQAAVALDNAQLVEGLEQQVAERTADLNQRVDELQIINDIQQALARNWISRRLSISLATNCAMCSMRTAWILIGMMKKIILFTIFIPVNKAKDIP